MTEKAPMLDVFIGRRGDAWRAHFAPGSWMPPMASTLGLISRDRGRAMPTVAVRSIGQPRGANAAGSANASKVFRSAPTSRMRRLSFQKSPNLTPSRLVGCHRPP